MYCIIIQRNVYAGELGISGHAHWLSEVNGWDPQTWPTVAEAREHIAELETERYVTDHGEAGRPDYWVVPVEAVEEILSNADDLSRYNWPGVDEVGCTRPQADGSECGACDRCLEWMACQDDDVLRTAQVIDDAERGDPIAVACDILRRIKLCTCTACGCREPATTTDDGGNPSCAACAEYTTDDGGDVYCSRCPEVEEVVESCGAGNQTHTYLRMRDDA